MIHRMVLLFVLLTFTPILFFFKLYQVDDDEEEDDNDTYDDRIRKNSTTITMINR